jgi:hypothetical protein
LTLESGVPVSSSDQTAKTTVYFTPFLGNQVALFDGNRWDRYTLTERNLALGTLTSGKNYDVFLYNNAGTLTLELSAAWASDTARTDAIAYQDGVYCKSGALTRRYVGTIRTTSTTTTEDSLAKRFVYNGTVGAQMRRALASTLETANSWSYSTAAWRQANANAANQVEWVDGLGTCAVWAALFSSGLGLGIGVDSTTANSALARSRGAGDCSAGAWWEGRPGLGYHYAAWIEYQGGTGTGYGDNNAPTVAQSRLIGTIYG